MHNIADVALQSADRAMVSDLVRPQEHLHQPKEQGDAEIMISVRSTAPASR